MANTTKIKSVIEPYVSITTIFDPSLTTYFDPPG